MNPALIPILGSAVKKLIDRAIPDKDKALEIKRQLDLDIQDIERTELKGAIDIIVAEAKGDSWLQRSWRPLLMIWFAGLVGAHWLGFTPDNLSQSTINQLLSIVQIGIGGYIVGRSGEKIMKEYKKSP
jgi:hypothetical protein